MGLKAAVNIKASNSGFDFYAEGPIYAGVFQAKMHVVVSSGKKKKSKKKSSSSRRRKKREEQHYGLVLQDLTLTLTLTLTLSLTLTLTLTTDYFFRIKAGVHRASTSYFWKIRMEWPRNRGPHST